MEHAVLELTGNECLYFALELSVNATWSVSDDPLEERAGGPGLRIRFLEPARGDPERVYLFRFSEAELWLLDELLRPELRKTKLPDGTSVMNLAHKLWDGLLGVAPELLFGARAREADEEVAHARDEDDHAHVGADANGARHQA